MSHRDRPDFGTHLSLGENRGSYVRATDRHLSLRSFRDNHSQSTLPLWDGFVNAPRRTGSASPSVPTGMAASGATPPSCTTAARRQQGSQVGSCGREPPEGLIEALPFLLECAEYLVESPPRILHAPFPVEDRVAKLYPRMGAKKTDRNCVRHRPLAPSASCGGGPDVRSRESSTLSQSRIREPSRGGVEKSDVCLDRGQGSDH